MPTTAPDIDIDVQGVRIKPSESAGVSPQAWPVAWGAIWVGALASLAVGLVLGLVGIALGAHQVGQQIVSWGDLSFGGLVFSVAGAFFSFVVGGWAAGIIAGSHRAETAALQGAVVWLVTVPLLLVLAALGAGNFFGGWYGGLAGMPAWADSTAAGANPDAALIARNSALGAVTALLLGLVGGVLGGWLASGEPMTMTYRRAKHEIADSRA